MTALSGPQLWLARALAASVAAWFAAWILLHVVHDAAHVATNVLWAVVPALAAVALVHGAFAPANRHQRAAFLWLAAACAAWGTGQAVWTTYDLGGGEIPYPSAADALWIGAKLAFACALLVWPRQVRTRRLSRWALLDGLIVAGVLAVMSLEFVVRPFSAIDARDAGALVGAAYPIGDALLIGAVTVGLVMQAWRDNGRIAVLAAGLIAMILSNRIWALSFETYEVGAFYDPGWTIGFALVGAVALVPAEWAARFALPPRAIPLAIAGLLLAVRAFQLSGYQGGVPRRFLIDAALVSVLFLLLVVRYAGLATAFQRHAREVESLRLSLEREHDVRDAALNGSRTGVCIIGDDGGVAFRNDAWRRLLSFVDDDDAAVRALVGGLAVEADASRERAALRFWTPDDRYLELAAASLPGNGTLLTADDITDQEQERATRDRFLAEVVGAQDYEARRVAELLHDDVVQRLTALGLRLELAATRSGDDALVPLAREAGEITGAIRRLLVELHPAVLESQGLSAAIDAAAESLRALGVEVVVEELETRLPPELEQLAYRLVQEALANALKHARASRVAVRLTLSARSLTCEVVDDGDGFEVTESSAAVRRGSLGIQLVRERVAMARGRFQLASRPGEGTTFRFELPLPARAAGEDTAQSGAAA